MFSALLRRKLPARAFRGLRRGSTVAALALLSLLGALFACELALRLFHPKYEDVARSNGYRVDEDPLYVRVPNTFRYYAHPDTGARHPVIYNDFGSRQHRRFDVESLKHAQNVAFFGDSYTENIRMEAQYSFTEVLDFLLNFAGREDGINDDQRRVNVLNFGVDGYGPGQEFRWYQKFPRGDDLDHVLYVFCGNDVEDFHNRRLFSLDEFGNLVANDAVRRGYLITALGRLHLTYLVLDFVQRLLPPPHERIEPTDDSVAAFQALLSHWEEVVAASGGTFRVVVLPYMTRESMQWVFPKHLDVVYLRECFSDMIPHFDYYDWSFRSDPHWNEAGNMVAAHCLYRLLEAEMGMPPISDAALASARHSYYAAVDTGGWSPPSAWVAPVAASAQPTLDPARIAAKYMQLDYRSGVLELLGNSTPAARGDWIVYRLPKNPRRRAMLAYAKTPCREEDREIPFFLHVTPRDPQRLSGERAVHGFDKLDFYFTDAGLAGFHAQANYVPRGGWTFNDHCVFGAELPSYEIARVRTGQYTADGLVWEVEIVFDGMAGEPS